MSESGDSDVTEECRSFSDNVIGRHSITHYPRDILGKIFVFWRDQWAKSLFTAVKHGDLHDGMKAPFVLSAVCHRFREVAHATPALWSLIYVDFGGTNCHIADRIGHMLWLAQDTPLTICFQAVNFNAYSKDWFRKMHAVLSPTNERWESVMASFAIRSDLAQCWLKWPLVGSSLNEIRIWGAIEEKPAAQPVPFLAGCQALRSVELRNVAWIHQATSIFPTVKSLTVGPSADQALGHTSVLHLCSSFSSIVQLRLFTFENTKLEPHAPPLPQKFCLQHLTHLTITPILLRTSLQGYEERRVLPALMSVSVHFSPNEDDELDEDEEHGSARRNDELETVGNFLRQHPVESLKLHGLCKGYSPSALCTSLLRAMNSSRLARLVLYSCRDYTTQYIGVAITKLSLAHESSQASRSGRVPRILQLHRGNGDQGSIYLLPRLQSLSVINCEDVDGDDVLAFVRAAPRWLQKVEIKESDIDESSYAQIKDCFM